MRISLNWLKDYLNLDGISADQISHAITFLGFEVEGVVHTGFAPLANVVVGEIRTRDKHPNADKLSVCTVDVGSVHGGVRTIVCGAPNCDAGRRVPVALPGAVLPGDFKIKSSKIRGQASDGMMCAPDELGLGAEHAGLLILDPAAPIGAPLHEVLPPGDTVFDLEITPNRPDALSHIGIARELAAWFRRDLTFPTATRHPFSAERRLDILADIRVDEPTDCPLYVGVAIAGVKVGPSPSWMQARLQAVGLRPINNLVDVGNYVMLELGQPLHVFDAKKIGGRKIVVRRAADGEKLVTLDGKERALNSRMLVIADESKPMVVAGIMGGASAEVDESTTDVVVEAAYFRPQSVRWTSKHLGLGSDSSYRFERGVDSHGTLEAAQRAVDLLVATAGGTVSGRPVVVGGGAPWSREISLTPDFVRQRLGFDISDEEIAAALQALGLGIVGEGESTPSFGRPQVEWTVDIPSHRGDLDRPIDLVEEVLRLYGTDRVPAAPSVGPALVDGDDDPIAVFNRKVTEYLVGQNFHECVNLTLRSGKELKEWVSAAAAQELALANPFVEDQSHLRPSIILGLLESLRLNQSRGNFVSRLCETGRVFVENAGAVTECVAVGFVIAHSDKNPSWLARPAPDFFAVKRHIEILASLGGVDLSNEEFSAGQNAYWGWQEGHSALAGELENGWAVRFGLINLAMSRSLGLEGQIWAGTLVLTPAYLAGRDRHRRRYQDFSPFPPALRDLALVVEAGRSAGELRRTLLATARKATTGFEIERVEVFDVYQGNNLPAGKKSLAFSLTFRSPHRTLTDDEVNNVFRQIQGDIVADGSIAIRG
ncbi:MAG TPA: phenylalanine--tRNA ligase subunit beta [Candidatus Didemnitutus sp.]|nr:phenylalanine--tRNA ligase subunit beta [Candidatus Didemnitutus sp.]